MKTLAVLFSNFGPYHVARLNQLVSTAREKRPELNVVGIELCRSYSVYPWQTDRTKTNFALHTVVDAGTMGTVPPPGTYRKLKKLLSEISPDFMAISGYSNPAMLLALRWCRKNRKKPILMSDSTEQDSVRIWIKEQLKRQIVKRFDSALVGGGPQRRYLEKLGMPPDRIFEGFDVIDNAVYDHGRIASCPRPIEAPFFLTVARFVPKKNLHRLTDAYAGYTRKHDKPWDLVICGDGELRPQIESQISRLHLESKVHLTGFLQQNDTLPYFAHAGCLIQPSTSDQWGLVVNEAMAASLPVIVSERCGCCEDLIEDGRNGFVFDPFSVKQLTELMARVSNEDLTSMRQASRLKIDDFPLSRFAEGLLAAIGRE